ncbi:Flp pilus assembly protein CpaB [Actinomarinicola tropica]|uniref:Flp pilus assembly protein CpaB n=1 Tax=Actinomarinicola tropica TaxID=2789776 RepID=UPI00189989E6|nr:Flp pilus assembly protein CpaB [Actinomarinicola tropica]
MILIAAIAVGAIAAFALFSYVQGIEDRANEDAELIEVFKVAQDIPKGLPGEQATAESYIERSEIPRQFLPANYTRSLETIEGKVALNDLSANQVLVEGMFVDPAAALITFSERLEDGDVAITVSVDQVRGVAGLLVPGDRVNIMVANQLEDSVPVVGSEGEETRYQQPARYLYHDVPIIAIGRSAVPQPGETVDPAAAETGTGTITFAVPPEAAQRIASVDPTSIYLSLVPPDYTAEAIPPLDLQESLPGEDGGRLTPFGPEGRE